MWAGMFTPQLQSCLPREAEPRLPEAGWPSLPEALQAAARWMTGASSPRKAGGLPPFPRPTGAVISLSRGTILAPRGSFSGALHLTLIGAAGLEGSTINVWILGGLGPKPWQPASMDQPCSSADTRTPPQLWVRQGLTLLSQL